MKYSCRSNTITPDEMHNYKVPDVGVVEEDEEERILEGPVGPPTAHGRRRSGGVVTICCRSVFRKFASTLPGVLVSVQNESSVRRHPR